MSIYSQKEAKTSHILGVDFGKSKIGLALADTETRIAFAYDTIKNDKNFLDNLIGIISDKGVEKVIIGIPSHVNREEVVYDGEKLGELLKNKISKLKVVYQDEMFTTKMAQDNLIEKGMKNVGQADDAEAARIILQSWLDVKKFT